MNIPRYSNLNRGGRLENRLNRLHDFVYAILLVVLIAVAGMIMNGWAERKSVFESLRNEIRNSNIKIEQQGFELEKTQKQINDIHMGLRLRGIIPK